MSEKYPEKPDDLDPGKMAQLAEEFLSLPPQQRPYRRGQRQDVPTTQREPFSKEKFQRGFALGLGTGLGFIGGFFIGAFGGYELSVGMNSIVAFAISEFIFAPSGALGGYFLAKSFLSKQRPPQQN